MPTTTAQNTLNQTMFFTIAHRTIKVDIVLVAVVEAVVVGLVVGEVDTLVGDEVVFTTMVMVEVHTTELILDEVVVDKVEEAEDLATSAVKSSTKHGNVRKGMITEKIRRIGTMMLRKLKLWTLRYDYMISQNHLLSYVTIMKKKIAMIKTMQN